MKALNDVNTLSWGRLCVALLACDDVAQLQRWLTEVAKGGSLYRALRVHGRLSAVRRAKELAALKTIVAAAQRERE